LCIADNFPRLEIRDLQKKPEQLTLFLHSLAAIMSPEHRPKASRFADLGQFSFSLIA
jgi:tyrosinase